jgi:hypothetical protein
MTTNGKFIPPKYEEKKFADAAKGNISVDDIVRTEWERSYRNSGISYELLKGIIIKHVEDGNDVYRLRNTVYLVTPDDEDYSEVRVDAFTADPREVYMTMTMMLCLGLNQSRGTEIVYTYTPSKALYRSFRKIFGDAGDIEDAKDDPNATAPYRLYVDIPEFIANVQEKQKAQQGAQV